jgi:tetratricopeptide (TPR) repeat protein
MTSCPETIPADADHAERHRAGSAWTDMGTAHLVSGGPGDWIASVKCNRRAVELLGGLPLAEDTSYLADLGAAWVNLGCALQADPSKGSLDEALDAFDRAIELLEQLPFEANSRFRHNLSAAWMNRADAFVQIGTATSLARALQAYGRAIEIARELPLGEKPSFRVLLASCWINRGNLHQRLQDFSGAVRAYDGALAAIGNLPRSGHRLACHHAATATTNRGEALLSDSPIENAQKAVESARIALEQIDGRDLDGLADAKLCLRALRVMARGFEAQMHGCNGQGADKVAALTDVAERGMDIALRSRAAAPDVFDPFVIWFFSFGSRAYGRHQPQFLAEYLEDALGRLEPHACPALATELRALARQAVSGALEGLGRNRLLVAGARQTELLMGTVRGLRNAVLQFDS